VVLSKPSKEALRFRNGILTGNALYASSSLALKKYERTHQKIAKMVDQLFPDTEKLDEK
jgi:hypothetical protein